MAASAQAAPALAEEPASPGSQAEPAAEIVIRGETEADRRRQSAEAVTVVDTELAQRRSADLGEVLARIQGIGVRRSGGLGSSMRFSLNGLTDEQVRFFLDGVPLELAGYPVGLANVPVNLVEHVEVYSGVVPTRFGADALAGAVNLVTDQELRGTKAAASYEMGSFDTHRVTLSGRYRHESGLFARANGFYDYARNHYPIDVEVPDEQGQPVPARVHRFHDGYRAAGANLEMGLADHRFARRFLVRLFVADYEKEYQHNVAMTVPYGGVSYGETSAGSSLRYQQRLMRGVLLDAIAGYTYTYGRFVDVATCVYDWYGRCVRERRQAGETDTRPHDQVYRDRVGYGRVNLSWLPHPQLNVRVSVFPTFLTRTGDELRQSDPTARDPLTAQRDLFSQVGGVEVETDLFDDRLENIAFVKHYFQGLESEEPRPGNVFRRRDRDTSRFGFGDALRYRFLDELYGKVSYELATRLPRPDEVFGDNAFIVANLELQPETTNNANLGLTLDARDTPSGTFRGLVNGFLRDTHDQIVLLGNDRIQSFQNVYAARSIGVEAAAGWTSPGEFFSIDANATYQDLRNTSSQGTFGAFKGDRLPNRQYLFGNVSAQAKVGSVVVAGDELSVSYDAGYVHEYFRSWESIGLLEFKQVIPAQLVHTVGVGYVVKGPRATLSSSFEIDNLTNEDVFDFYGVQRPGRAFYVKTTAEL
jgi:vitamin B12 transporter